MGLKNSVRSIKDFFSQNKNLGLYSPNKSLLFFLVSIFLFMLLLGRSLESLTYRIKNPYISKIYQGCISPISDLSQKFKLDNLIPSARTYFLNYAGLEGLSDWDSFYYTDSLAAVKENSAHSDEKKNENSSLKENVSALETKLENLNSLLDRLKKLEQIRLAEIEKLRSEQDALKLKEKNLVDSKTDNRNQDEENLEKSQEPKKVYTYNAENPLRILMIGDSQMHNLAAGFLRLIGENSSIRVKEISVHSSGFIRSDYYNWPKKLKAVFEESKNEPYDIAVVFLGMNDYQNFYGNDGKVLVKETEAWEAAYRDKIKTLLDIVSANTKRVYWLGMPLVRTKIYNAQLSYIEELHKKIASEYPEPLLKKISLSSIAPGKGVPYTDTVKTYDGKKIKLMRDDGNHYTIAGGEYIMTSFLNILYEDWDIEPCNS